MKWQLKELFLAAKWSENQFDFDDVAEKLPVVVSLPVVVAFSLILTLMTVLIVGGGFNLSLPVVNKVQPNRDLLEIKTALENMSVDFPNFKSLILENGGISIPIASDDFFLPGQAQLDNFARRELVHMLSGLMRVDKGFRLAVEGHTDNMPLKKWKWKFPSNWELSAQRAGAIVRLFEEYDFPAKNMVAVGFGSQKPKLPNQDEKGENIVVNQAANRRITIRIYPLGGNVGG